MKVALLGATGFVGSALLKEALNRGHIVTAIVRHPEKLEKREGLAAKAGDVYDTTSLATLIQGNDAIISAFNPGWKNPNLYDDQVRAVRPRAARASKCPPNNLRGVTLHCVHRRSFKSRSLHHFAPFGDSQEAALTSLGMSQLPEGYTLINISAASSCVGSLQRIRSDVPSARAHSVLPR
jgi:uncharacterized protein YbjT (DUF2867 family)